MRLFTIAALCCMAIAPLALSAETGSHPVALAVSADGATLYVAEYCGRRVSYYDTASGEAKAFVDLAEAPSSLALSPDGARLYVAGAAPAGKIFIIDIAAKTVAQTIDAGHTPSAVIVSPNGLALYVCNRFNNNVAVYELPGGALVGKIDVPREPVAAAVTPDGARLVVANHLAAGVANGDYIAANVSIIDTASRGVVASVQLPNGSAGLRGVCIAPDGAFAYVTHVLGRYQLPTTQLERGWMNTNALSVIDVKAGTLVNTVLLDDVDLGAANPWGAACTADGKQLCVAHAGTHEISVIDRIALHEKLAKVAAGERVSDVSSTPGDVPNDLAFLVGVRRRVRLVGNGPRGLAIAGTNVYAAEYFSDSIGCLDLASQRANPAISFNVGEAVEMSQVQRGEMLFNDATMCFQHWQSCASCHPDSRADGLNWDLLNDGIGNPKNTKSMLLSHQTPPVMSTGIRENAELAVRSGMKFIQFTVRPEEDAAALDAYLKSMQPVPSPVPVDDATKRGEAVFNSAGCANCHPAPLYTDLQAYELGTGMYGDAGKKFDTPTLVEVWRTAPFLHDGRAATIRDLLTVHNPGDKHGDTSKLSEQDLSDLTQFVLTR